MLDQSVLYKTKPLKLFTLFCSSSMAYYFHLHLIICLIKINRVKVWGKLAWGLKLPKLKEWVVVGVVVTHGHDKLMTGVPYPVWLESLTLTPRLPAIWLSHFISFKAFITVWLSYTCTCKNDNDYLSQTRLLNRYLIRIISKLIFDT